MTLFTSISSSSPDETMMPPPLSMVDDFKQFQELIKRIADILQIPLEQAQSPTINC